MSAETSPIPEPSLPVQSADLGRELLEDLPSPVRATDPQNKAFYFNRAWLEFTGRPLQSELGGGWLESIHPEDLPGFLQSLRQASANGLRYEAEYRLRRRDGAFRWIIDRGNPTLHSDGHLRGLVSFCFDSTARRATAEARREIEEQTRLLGLATGDMVWSWDIFSDRVVCNSIFAEAFGDLPGPLESSITWFKQRIHPDDLARVVSAFQRALSQAAQEAACEYRLRRSDGSYVSIDDRLFIERDESGCLRRVIGAMRDITARKRTEEAQARLTGILEATSDFVAMTDRQGRILYMNQAGRRRFGWVLDGEKASWLLRDTHPEWVDDLIQQEAIPAAIEHGTWTGESAILDQNGQEVPVSHVVIAHLGADREPEYFSSIMRDVSEGKREEIARIEWANRYDAAVRASGQLLFDWNSATNEISYGGDTQTLLGYRIKEMSGGLPRLRELIHPEDLPAFDQEIARVSATHAPFRVSFRLQRKDGALIFIDAKGYFFLDRQGGIARMVGFLADVTEPHLARAQLARARENLEQRVAERTAELEQTYVVIKDRALQQGSVAHLGQKALAGASLQDLFDEATELVRTTLKVNLCTVLERAQDGLSLFVRSAAGWPPGSIQNTIPTGNASQSGYTLEMGEPIIVEDMRTETRFAISKPAVDVGALSAITVPIQAELEAFGVLATMSTKRRVFTQDDANFLQSISNILTAAIDRQRAEARIRRAQEQAEAANRAKSVFLSRMSHELRTPLNAILGFSELLHLDAPSPRQTESISHISRAGQHLLTLINEVLDIARIDVGTLSLSVQPIELVPFLRATLEEIRPTAERHNIELHLATNPLEAPQIFSDRPRCRQILFHLLSNAIKFNRPQGSVTLDWVAIAENRLRILITDTGAGLTPDKIAGLFSPFERLGAESTGVTGAGVGLAFSQRIANALQSVIGVESTPGVGSTFWFEVPCCPPPDLNSIPPELVSIFTEVEPTKILYIEDQDFNVRLVERILDQRPATKLLACSQGFPAIEMARQENPDLILLDLSLPDTTGEEVLRQLKADPLLKTIPTIVVSAEVIAERIERLLAMGAAAFLNKPYQVSDFLDLINKTLAQADLD